MREYRPKPISLLSQVCVSNLHNGPDYASFVRPTHVNTNVNTNVYTNVNTHVNTNVNTHVNTNINTHVNTNVNSNENTQLHM